MWLCLAAALYAAFLVVVVRAVLQRLSATCACFGTLGSGSIGWPTVARNTVLLAIALLGLGAADAGGVLAGVAGLVVVAGVLGYAVMAGRRQTRARAGALELQDVAGGRIALREFADPPTVLAFFSPHCGSCHALVPDFRWWPHALPEGLDLQPVFLGVPQDFAAAEAFQPLVEHAWYDPEREVFRALGGSATPAAIRIDRAHPLGESWFVGAARMQELVFRPGFDREAAAREGEQRAAATDPPASPAP